MSSYICYSSAEAGKKKERKKRKKETKKNPRALYASFFFLGVVKKFLMVEYYHPITETPFFLYFSHQPARLSVHFRFSHGQSPFTRLQQPYNLLWTLHRIF